MTLYARVLLLVVRVKAARCRSRRGMYVVESRCLGRTHSAGVGNNKCSLQGDRRNGVEYPRDIVRRHLTILQTAHLTSFAQPLKPKSEFPAFGLVDEEDVFLAVGIANRGAENVEMFSWLCAGLVGYVREL